nr:MAG TPA: hypothetical protein [Caudoviricetes sp.]
MFFIFVINPISKSIGSITVKHFSFNECSSFWSEYVFYIRNKSHSLAPFQSN